MTRPKQSKAGKQSSVKKIREASQTNDAKASDKEVDQRQLDQVSAGGASPLMNQPRERKPWPPCDTDNA